MNVNRIVNKSINLVSPQMHDTRREALASCVSSLLHGNIVRLPLALYLSGQLKLFHIYPVNMVNSKKE
ncbi:MAG: hypothetical protein ACJASI_002748 [Glaciecola sp.]|jgi:hypothetical protein